jgi:hypothetical protein
MSTDSIEVQTVTSSSQNALIRDTQATFTLTRIGLLFV